MLETGQSLNQTVRLVSTLLKPFPFFLSGALTKKEEYHTRRACESRTLFTSERERERPVVTFRIPFPGFVINEREDVQERVPGRVGVRLPRRVPQGPGLERPHPHLHRAQEPQ